MTNTKITIAEEMKELLSNPNNMIKLDDFVTEHLKVFLDATNLEHFPVQDSNVQKEDFCERLQKYEEIVKDLQQIVILLARWGNGGQLSVLEKIFSRIEESDKGSSGINLWLHLGWYPIQVLIYSAGIAALSTSKYDALQIILTTPTHNISEANSRLPIAVTVALNLSAIHDSFKWIPGHERKHVPCSEHLFQILQPIIEDLLFVGKSYERLFDYLEVYLALVYADTKGINWGPIGRFGWKHGRGLGDSPFDQLVEEARKAKSVWLPLQSNLFNGSLERFLEVSEAFRQRLNELSWW